LEDYIFHEGVIREGYEPHLDYALFNQQNFLQLQSAGGWLTFYILDKKHKHVSAFIHFHIDEKIARSHLRSPFGSFEFSKELPAIILFDFVKFIETRLRTLNVQKVIIKNPPDLYRPHENVIIQTFLLNNGFHVDSAEISSIVEVSENAYEDLLHIRKRRKLRQSQNQKLHFEILSHDRLAEAYKFIESCRDDKKFKLSISLDHLAKTVACLSKDYILFGVVHNEKLVAVSITVRVNKNVLYHFISDYLREVDGARPGLVLMQGIYNYCQTLRIRILDLGTSTEDGKPNFNLLNYKKELGAIPTAKLTFAKELL
jgi:hypothetical protein